MKSYDEKKVNSVTAKMVIHMNIDDLKKLNPYYLVKNDDSKLPIFTSALDSMLTEFMSDVSTWIALFPIYLSYISFKSISFL